MAVLAFVMLAIHLSPSIGLLLLRQHAWKSQHASSGNATSVELLTSESCESETGCVAVSSATLNVAAAAVTEAPPLSIIADCARPADLRAPGNGTPAWRAAMAGLEADLAFQQRHLAPWVVNMRHDPPVLRDCRAREVPMAKAFLPTATGFAAIDARVAPGGNESLPVLVVGDFGKDEDNFFHGMVLYGAGFWCAVAKAQEERRAGDSPPTAIFLGSIKTPAMLSFHNLMWLLSNAAGGGEGGGDEQPLPQRFRKIYRTYGRGSSLSLSFENRPNTAPDEVWITALASVVAEQRCEPRTDLGAPYILVHLRCARRFLLDAETGTPDGVVAALRAKNMSAVVVADGDLKTRREEVCLYSQARAILSVHGAQLTNMIWMPRGSTVVEISYRRGFCCDPIPAVTLSTGAPCTHPCRRYHKADFVNLARRVGHVVDEYADVVAHTRFFNANPISRDVFVNSTHLAEHVARVLEGPRE